MAWNSGASAASVLPIFTTSNSHFRRPSISPRKFLLPFWAYPFTYIPNKFHILHARKGRSKSDQPLLRPTIVEEVSEGDEDDAFSDDFADGNLIPPAPSSPFTLHSSFKFFFAQSFFLRCLNLTIFLPCDFYFIFVGNKI